MFSTTVQDPGTIQPVRFTVWTKAEGNYEFYANAPAPIQQTDNGDYRHNGHPYHVMANERDATPRKYRAAAPIFRRTKADAEQLCKRLGGIEFRELETVATS